MNGNLGIYLRGIFFLFFLTLTDLSWSQVVPSDHLETLWYTNPNTSDLMEEQVTIGLPLGYAPRRKPKLTDKYEQAAYDYNMRHYYLNYSVAILETSEDNLNNKFVCGGMIILPGVVLAAANCFKQYKSFENLVVTNGDKNTGYAQVKNIVPYHDYIPDSFYNDIALLRYDIPLRLEEVTAHNYHNLRLVTIVPYAMNSDYSMGAYASDWDAKDPHEPSSVWVGTHMHPIGNWEIPRNKVPFSTMRKVQIISRELCEEKYRQFYIERGLDFDATFPYGIDQRLICVNGDDLNLCSQNRGQILLMGTENRVSGDEEPLINYAIMGIRSPSAPGFDFIPPPIQCANERFYLPGLYTRIDTVVVWAAYTGRDLHDESLVEKKEEMNEVYWKSHTLSPFEEIQDHIQKI